MNPTAEDTERRRPAMLRLARSVRGLVDSAVSCGLAAPEVDAIAVEVDVLAARLAEVRHPGPYSGLLGDIDVADPHSYTPLTPMAGRFNPIAPPLELTIVEGRAHGRVVLGRQHTGPPALAHGGSLASLCDQMVGIAAWTAGLRAFTTTLSVRFLRPCPLDETLHLEAWVDDQSAGALRAHAVIRVGERAAVEAVSDLKVVELNTKSRAAATEGRPDGPAVE